LAFLRDIFLFFEATSGLKVNLAKSMLIPMGNVQQVDYLASILGCEVASLPFEYLGLPLGLPITLPIFGTVFWRRWNVIWLVGNGLFCLGGGGGGENYLDKEAPFPTFSRIICLFSRFPIKLPIALRSFNVTSYGVELGKNSYIIW
jgi:hypothetical protein